MNLNNSYVSTLAGNSNGPSHANGVGTNASFVNPVGIVYHHSGVLYVADASYVRKVVIANATVTTVAMLYGDCQYLCVSNNGALLYVTMASNITLINISSDTSEGVTTLAGTNIVGFGDGHAALFNFPCGGYIELR